MCLNSYRERQLKNIKKWSIMVKGNDERQMLEKLVMDLGSRDNVINGLRQAGYDLMIHQMCRTERLSNPQAANGIVVAQHEEHGTILWTYGSFYIQPVKETSQPSS